MEVESDLLRKKFPNRDSIVFVKFPYREICLHTPEINNLLTLQSSYLFNRNFYAFTTKGHDTTTSTITWFLYLVGSHVQYQVNNNIQMCGFMLFASLDWKKFILLHYEDRIFEELRDVFGDSTDTRLRDCTQEDLNNLNFM